MTCKCQETNGQHAAAIIDAVDRLRATLAPSDQAVELRAARAVQVGSTIGGTKRPTTSGGRIVGWSLRETTGAAGATVIFRAGADASGAEIASCTLTAGESDREWFGPAGIDVAGGLFVDVTAGQVAGSVFLGAVD